MLGRLLSLFVAITLICGGALAPAIAHANDTASENASELLHLDAHVSADDDQSGEDGNKADHPGAHHHCPVALETATGTSDTATDLGRCIYAGQLTSILGSFAQAPPIEPPAA